ncbi:Scr1 family TA system antitoxin-like transcriptional regulator [Streptomyces sp. NPDC017979]|uniref:helix-turn-helix domain-containing protein n=1 Tax=Streptomyces sp. NPDC017979 TaxID=3365024 RepID=UPI0037AD1DA1
MNRKELNPEASAQAAYGARLRSLRDGRGLTQDELASLMGYSGRHISAVETGRRTPTRQFSLSADRIFELEGAADTFERAFREIRHGALLQGFPEYLGYEGRAVELRLYEIGIMPGLLQTSEYATALESGEVQRGSISADQAEERVRVLMQRQAALVRDRSPMMFVVMDESCIRRQVGSREVMDAQLDRLLAFAEQPNAMLHIAPYAIGERRPFNLPLNLLTLPDLSMVAYAESQMQGHMEREIPVILPLLTAYHQLQAVSLSSAASVDMINQIRKGTP